jgi:dolichyl-phosphate-mannose-protein mannosyltransferase
MTGSETDETRGHAAAPNVAECRAPWALLDSVMIGAITVFAAAMRIPTMRRGRAVWDETVYVPDACLYVRGGHGRCGITSEISVVHPPLAKWLIGAGIRIFGYTPAGWRVVPFIAGTLIITTVYLLAHRLFGSTLTASLASGLLAFDFLYFVMSRSAMLDVFVVFFSLVMFLCFVYDRGSGAISSTRGRVRTRPWLIAAGLAGGAATASKWSGGYLLIAVIVLAVADAIARQGDVQHRLRRAARDEGIVLAIALVLVPLLVYIATYAGRIHGSVLALPWANGAWSRAFIARQHLMYEHHTGRLYSSPYGSAAWSWFLVKRPVVFDFVNLGNGRYQEVLALGNPLVWWAGIIGVSVTAWRWLRHSRDRLATPQTVVLAGFFAGYVPWLVISRDEAFLYYLLPALPFMYIALADTIARVHSRYSEVVAVVTLAAISVGAFAFYRPLLTGETIPYKQWQARLLFRHCGDRTPEGRRVPVMRPISPPPGWCWV